MSTVTYIDAKDITINDKIISNVEDKDYTAFEVYPTYKDILAGTLSDVKTIVYEYENGRSYSIDDIVTKNDQIYTCKQYIAAGNTIIPSITNCWEEYWKVGSEHEPDGLYLTYAQDVPAEHILNIQFYTYQKKKSDNDIIIDWGDGQITEIAKSNVMYTDYSSQGYMYSGFVVSHDYAEEGKFIVKIFGKDYFMLRCSQSSLGRNIVSRIFDRDLPVASCLKNISSLARHAMKLLKVEIPYEYDFKNISNWANLFCYCYNLKKFKTNGGIILTKPFAYGNMFNGCTSLESNINDILDMLRPTYLTNGYDGVFSDCKKLYGKINGYKLWLDPSFENIQLNTSTCFKRCSAEIRKQVPLSWGGLNTEIANKPYRRTSDRIAQANVQFNDIYSGLKKNGIIQETIETIDVSDSQFGYAVYADGSLADTSNSSFRYFDIDNIIQGQKFCIKTTLEFNLGICIYDHEYLIKSWNSDGRIQISGYNDSFSNINTAYAVLSDEMTLEQLQETLLTATRNDPIHYRRANYVEYSEYFPSSGQLEIIIPEGGTKLRISGKANRPIEISSIIYEYLDKPEQYQISAATEDNLGGIKIGYVQNGQNYPVQLSNQMAYVNVPWNDIAIESAWYDASSKNIVIHFNDAAKDEISVNVSSLIDVYNADGNTLELNGNTFSVKDNVFQPKGDYLSSDALDDYLTKTSADVDYQPKGDYLSSDALTNYYSKSETSSNSQIDTAITSINSEINWLDNLSKSRARSYNLVELPTDKYVKYGCFLYSNGRESDYSQSYENDRACTKFIPITSSDVVEYTGHIKVTATMCNQYAIYDENFNCLSAYSPTAELNGTYEIQLSDIFALYENGTLTAEPKYIRLAMLGNKNSEKFKIRKTNEPTYFGYIADNVALKAIDKESESIEFFDSECSLSSFIANTGNIATGSGSTYNAYIVSPFIKVDPFDKIELSGHGESIGSTTRYIVAFYDETSAFIYDSGYPKVKSGVGTVTTLTAIAPKNAEFMRIGGYVKSKLPEPHIKCRISKSVQDQAICIIEKELNRLESYSTKAGSLDEFVKPFCETKHQYITASTGNLGGNDALFECTDFLPIKKGDLFYYTGIVRISSCGFAVYDNDKNFLSSYLLAPDTSTVLSYQDYLVDATQLIEEYEALDTGNVIAYIRFSNYAKNSNQILKVTRNNAPIPAIYLIDKLEEQVRELSASDGLKNVLYGKNYLTFGDSYTLALFSSWTDPEGRTGQDSPIAYDSTKEQWKSYGWHIADRNAMLYTNMAKNGGTLTYNISSEDGAPQTANSFAKDLTTESTFASLSGPIASADYITIAYGLNDDHKRCPVGEYTDSEISTMWGAWNTVLSTIYELNPDVKLGIILNDGGFTEDQRNRQLSVAGYWGIPVLDLKGDPQVPLMIGSSSNYGNRPRVNSWIIQKKAEIFQMSNTDAHPNPYAHEYRSTVIEDFLRRL